MSTQSSLLASIAKAEMLVQAQQIHLAEHKLYFANFKRDHKLMLITLLLPAFVAGWQAGKQLRIGGGLTQLTNYVLFTLWAKARKVYLLG